MLDRLSLPVSSTLAHTHILTSAAAALQPLLHMPCNSARTRESLCQLAANLARFAFQSFLLLHTSQASSCLHWSRSAAIQGARSLACSAGRLAWRCRITRGTHAHALTPLGFAPSSRSERSLGLHGPKAKAQEAKLSRKAGARSHARTHQTRSIRFRMGCP